MASTERLNCSGLPQYHLRRIGPPATKAGVADIMDFHKVITLIGRRNDQVDYLIDSNSRNRSVYISRVHARVVRNTSGDKVAIEPVANDHRLHDDSLNGIFINNMKISGSVILREGDRVTFGHPQGNDLLPGTRIRQPDSEYQFIFERCCCPPDSNTGNNNSNTFAVPRSKASKSRKHHPTMSFTPAECKKMKAEYEEKHGQKSNVDSDKNKNEDHANSVLNEGVTNSKENSQKSRSEEDTSISKEVTRGPDGRAVDANSCCKKSDTINVNEDVMGCAVDNSEMDTNLNHISEDTSRNANELVTNSHHIDADMETADLNANSDGNTNEVECSENTSSKVKCTDENPVNTVVDLECSEMDTNLKVRCTDENPMDTVEDVECSENTSSKVECTDENLVNTVEVVECSENTSSKVECTDENPMDTVEVVECSENTSSKVKCTDENPVNTVEDVECSENTSSKVECTDENPMDTVEDVECSENTSSKVKCTDENPVNTVEDVKCRENTSSKVECTDENPVNTVEDIECSENTNSIEKCTDENLVNTVEDVECSENTNSIEKCTDENLVNTVEDIECSENTNSIEKCTDENPVNTVEDVECSENTNSIEKCTDENLVNTADDVEFSENTSSKGRCTDENPVNTFEDEECREKTSSKVECTDENPVNTFEDEECREKTSSKERCADENPVNTVEDEAPGQGEIEQEEKTNAENEAERHSTIEKENEHVRKLNEEEMQDQEKKEKYDQTTKDEIDYMQTELKLVQVDNEIKKCVQKDSCDEERCLEILDDLSSLPVSPVMLKKNPEIIKTIKMIRKYKDSDKIRKKADEIYQKFKSICLQEDGEGNMTKSLEDEVTEVAVIRSTSAGPTEEELSDSVAFVEEMEEEDISQSSELLLAPNEMESDNSEIDQHDSSQNQEQAEMVNDDYLETISQEDEKIPECSYVRNSGEHLSACVNADDNKDAPSEDRPILFSDSVEYGEALDSNDDADLLTENSPVHVRRECLESYDVQDTNSALEITEDKTKLDIETVEGNSNGSCEASDIESNFCSHNSNDQNLANKKKESDSDNQVCMEIDVNSEEADDCQIDQHDKLQSKIQVEMVKDVNLKTISQDGDKIPESSSVDTSGNCLLASGEVEYDQKDGRNDQVSKTHHSHDDNTTDENDDDESGQSEENENEVSAASLKSLEEDVMDAAVIGRTSAGPMEDSDSVAVVEEMEGDDSSQSSELLLAPNETEPDDCDIDLHDSSQSQEPAEMVNDRNLQIVSQEDDEIQQNDDSTAGDRAMTFSDSMEYGEALYSDDDDDLLTENSPIHVSSECLESNDLQDTNKNERENTNSNRLNHSNASESSNIHVQEDETKTDIETVEGNSKGSFGTTGIEFNFCNHNSNDQNLPEEKKDSVSDKQVSVEIDINSEEVDHSDQLPCKGINDADVAKSFSSNEENVPSPVKDQDRSKMLGNEQESHILHETESTGLSPVSKNIAVVTNFVESLNMSPAEESNGKLSQKCSDDNKQFLSPVSKQLLDRRHIKEMMQHLEDSISSADEDISGMYGSDVNDCSYEAPNLPPVFILDSFKGDISHSKEFCNNNKYGQIDRNEVIYSCVPSVDIQKLNNPPCKVQSVLENLTKTTRQHFEKASSSLNTDVALEQTCAKKLFAEGGEVREELKSDQSFEQSAKDETQDLDVSCTTSVAIYAENVSLISDDSFNEMDSLKYESVICQSTPLHLKNRKSGHRVNNLQILEETQHNIDTAQIIAADKTGQEADEISSRLEMDITDNFDTTKSFDGIEDVSTNTEATCEIEGILETDKINVTRTVDSFERSLEETDCTLSTTFAIPTKTDEFGDKQMTAHNSATEKANSSYAMEEELENVKSLIDLGDAHDVVCEIESDSSENHIRGHTTDTVTNMAVSAPESKSESLVDDLYMETKNVDIAAGIENEVSSCQQAKEDVTAGCTPSSVESEIIPEAATENELQHPPILSGCSEPVCVASKEQQIQSEESVACEPSCVASEVIEETGDGEDPPATSVACEPSCVASEVIEETGVGKDPPAVSVVCEPPFETSKVTKETVIENLPAVSDAGEPSCVASEVTKETTVENEQQNLTAVLASEVTNETAVENEQRKFPAVSVACEQSCIASEVRQDESCNGKETSFRFRVTDGLSLEALNHNETCEPRNISESHNNSEIMFDENGKGSEIKIDRNAFETCDTVNMETEVKGCTSEKRAAGYIQKKSEIHIDTCSSETNSSDDKITRSLKRKRVSVDNEEVDIDIAKRQKLWTQNVESILDNYFRIQTRVAEQRTLDKKLLQKSLIGKLVTRFFIMKSQGHQVDTVCTSEIVAGSSVIDNLPHNSISSSSQTTDQAVSAIISSMDTTESTKSGYIVQTPTSSLSSASSDMRGCAILNSADCDMGKVQKEGDNFQGHEFDCKYGCLDYENKIIEAEKSSAANKSSFGQEFDGDQDIGSEQNQLTSQSEESNMSSNISEIYSQKDTGEATKGRTTLDKECHSQESYTSESKGFKDIQYLDNSENNSNAINLPQDDLLSEEILIDSCAVQEEGLSSIEEDSGEPSVDSYMASDPQLDDTDEDLPFGLHYISENEEITDEKKVKQSDGKDCVTSKEGTLVNYTSDSREEMVVSDTLDSTEELVVSETLDSQEETIVNDRLDSQEETLVSDTYNSLEEMVVRDTFNSPEKTLVSHRLVSPKETVVSDIFTSPEEMLVSHRLDSPEESVVSDRDSPEESVVSDTDSPEESVVSDTLASQEEPLVSDTLNSPEEPVVSDTLDTPEEILLIDSALIYEKMDSHVEAASNINHHADGAFLVTEENKDSDNNIITNIADDQIRESQETMSEKRLWSRSVSQDSSSNMSQSILVCDASVYQDRVAPEGTPCFTEDSPSGGADLSQSDAENCESATDSSIIFNRNSKFQDQESSNSNKIFCKMSNENMSENNEMSLDDFGSYTDKSYSPNTSLHEGKLMESQDEMSCKESEVFTESTDLSSVNYCPLPDLGEDLTDDQYSPQPDIDGDISYDQFSLSEDRLEKSDDHHSQLSDIAEKDISDEHCCPLSDVAADISDNSNIQRPERTAGDALTDHSKATGDTSIDKKIPQADLAGRHCPLPDMAGVDILDVDSSPEVGTYKWEPTKDIYISESSDELPEVIFLKEDKGTPSKIRSIKTEMEESDPEVIYSIHDATESCTKVSSMIKDPLQTDDSPRALKNIKEEKSVRRSPRKRPVQPEKQVETPTAKTSVKVSKTPRTSRKTPSKQTCERQIDTCSDVGSKLEIDNTEGIVAEEELKVEQETVKKNTKKRKRRRPLRKREALPMMIYEKSRCVYSDDEVQLFEVDSSSSDENSSFTKFKSTSIRCKTVASKVKDSDSNNTGGRKGSDGVLKKVGILEDDIRTGEGSVQDVFTELPDSLSFCEDVTMHQGEMEVSRRLETTAHVNSLSRREDNSEDDDFVPGTCEEDSEDQAISADQTETTSQCLSPVIPNISKSTDNSREKTDKIFSDDDDFSAPSLDWDAIECDEINPGLDSDLDSAVQSPQPSCSKTTDDVLRARHCVENDSPQPRPMKRKLFVKNDDSDFSSPSKQNKTRDSPIDLDMVVSTQCEAVHMSNTQFDSESRQLLSLTDKESSDKRKRAKDLLANLRAKRQKCRVLRDESPSRDVSPHSSQETPGEINPGAVQRRILTPAQATNDHVTRYMTACKNVISSLRSALYNNNQDLARIPRVAQWKKDLKEIEDKTVNPRTVIAVVGDTGEGKSSLMNALIDQRNALPTSGMQACTAVVVEIKNNDTSSDFEADIQFLSRKEWQDELQLLLTDLTTADGKIKKNVPDPDTEAGVAYLKVRAVYGRVDTYQVLSRIQTVTRWLDQTRTIRSKDPDQFHRMIDRYIENKEKVDQTSTGGEFWPIVKMVTIRLPNCDAVSSGAVLVDLPGVRDSNAARDKIAKDYLKNCTAVWVVASIHRAVNNKTAKEMLGENFRRQLLMDGQYGSVAFVCTKSDSLNASELIRNLDLREVCKPLKNEIKALQMEKDEADVSQDNSKHEIKSLKKQKTKAARDLHDLQKDLEHAQEMLQEDSIDLDGEGMEEMEALKKEMSDMEKNIQEMEDNITDKEKEMDIANRKSLELEKKMNVRRKKINAICAKARNEYSATQIKKDFKAGLREMKRRAEMNEEDDDMDEEDDYNSDNDGDDIGSSADNLKVFCVSSVEYQKMKKLLTDGPPTVFSSVEDTQIPSLRAYIHEMTSVRRTQAAERLIRNLGRYVFDIHGYITDDTGTSCKSTRMGVKSAIEAQCSQLQQRFEPALVRLTENIEEVLSRSIETKMKEAVVQATAEASVTATKWGSKVNKEDRSKGGLHWMTYRCTVRRQGQFNSPTFGQIDFNEQLSEPMFRCISISWDRIFSGLLWQQIELCKSSIFVILRQFSGELCRHLNTMNVPKDRTDRVSNQLFHSSTEKLTEMVNFLKETVMSRQRDISRVLVPTVQESMDGTYLHCSEQAGSGMYQRMRDIMSEGVESHKLQMFDTASRKLLTELIELKIEILSHVRAVCLTLCNMLQTSFEPMWEAPVNSQRLRDILDNTISSASEEVKKLYRDANIALPVALPGFGPSPTSSTVVSAAGNAGDVIATTSSSAGPQMYTMAYQGTQRITTDSVGRPQAISMEETRSSYVTNMKTIKQEPGMSTPLSTVTIKKEWTADQQRALHNMDGKMPWQSQSPSTPNPSTSTLMVLPTSQKNIIPASHQIIFPIVNQQKTFTANTSGIRLSHPGNKVSISQLNQPSTSHNPSSTKTSTANTSGIRLSHPVNKVSISQLNQPSTSHNPSSTKTSTANTSGIRLSHPGIKVSISQLDQPSTSHNPSSTTTSKNSTPQAHTTNKGTKSTEVQAKKQQAEKIYNRLENIVHNTISRRSPLKASAATGKSPLTGKSSANDPLRGVTSPSGKVSKLKVPFRKTISDNTLQKYVDTENIPLSEVINSPQASQKSRQSKLSLKKTASPLRGQSPVTIKKEPVDHFTPRLRKPKNLGLIVLSSDSDDDL